MFIQQYLSLSFLFLSLVKSCAIFVTTPLPEFPVIAVELQSVQHIPLVHEIMGSFPEDTNVSRAVVQQAIQEVRRRIPSARLCTTPDEFLASPAISRLLASQNLLTARAVPVPVSVSVQQSDHLCRYERAELKPLQSFEEWRNVIKGRNCYHLPVKVFSRESIIHDAVKSYKDFDSIPFLVYHHLYYRNIQVEMETGIDMGGPRNEFFTVFFQELIENSPYFYKNPEGNVVLTPGLTSSYDLDVYEAFGFYLAKALQNGVPVEAQFSEVILDMIQLGKLVFTDIKLMESWDAEVAQSLRMLSQLSDSDLRFCNFTDICSTYPSISCSRANVKIFNALKMAYSLKDFKIQLVMISLGFIRACPPHIASKLINLNSHFMGEFNLSARDLINCYRREGSAAETEVFNTFATWLESLSPVQFKSFFRYITGLRVLPKGGLSVLDPKPTVSITDAGNEHRYPHANTCLRILYLPPYGSEAETLQKLNGLMKLIESGEAFGFGLA